MGCLWLQGVAGSGKTTWLRIISKLLPSAALNIKDEKFQSATGDTDQALVCTMNDIEPNYMTRTDNRVLVLNLCEREGIDLNTKNKDIKKTLIGASTIVTSNTLPRLSRAQYEITKLRDRIFTLKH